MKRFKKWCEENNSKIEIVFLIISSICVITSLILKWCGVSDLIFDPSWIAILLCGLPIIIGAIKGVVFEHDITADLLVSLALIGSMILKEWFAAGEVAVIMQIGSLLEELTAAKAEKGIQKLIKISPRTANLIVDGKEKIIDSSTIKIGDILRVKAGETIPVDGIILEGYTSIDQSIMTGESLPIDKKINDYVMSGTINQSGSFLMKATKTSEDSSLQRMISIAKSADAQKAKIVRKANKWASILVVVSLLTALISGVIIGCINKDFWLGFSRAVTVLVVFCPCAFVLATPTAISAGIGNASRNGVLIQSGEALERISECNIVVFDKTGTLTKGEPTVEKIETFNDVDKDELLKIAASGEKLSNHPLAKAICKYYKGDLYAVNNHQTINGWGVEFELNNNKYKIGKTNKKNDNSDSVVAIYRNELMIGVIHLEDEIKANAKDMIKALHLLGKRVVMLTGDNEATAKKVVKDLNIDEFKSDCSPEDKMKYIEEQEKLGNKVAMFGDGVNDSLALRKAYAGIAMGTMGSDVAIESSDAVIVHDNLETIPYLFKIAKKTQSRITLNLIISLVLNFIAVTLSIAGILNTVFGALFHNCGSVAVVISAFLLLYDDVK